MTEGQNQIEGELADSIAMLEQILEVMPNDAEALKAVYNAYCQASVPDQAFSYLRKLVGVIEAGSAPQERSFVEGELSRYEDQFPVEVSACHAQLHSALLSGSLANRAVESDEPEVPVGLSPRSILDEEMALAWKLYEAKQLTDDEYSSVLHDLGEVAAKDLNIPCTVLHVLSDQGFPQMSRVVNYISSESGAPCIRIADFELDEALANVLPEDLLTQEGALPFAFFGEDILVGVLNPFDSTLVQRVESSSGQRCHTYVVEPGDYDDALEKMLSLAAKAE